jgi:hypothetical protein
MSDKSSSLVSLFAIDPGGTTGWAATLNLDISGPICEEDIPFVRGECGWLGDGVDPDATGHFASTFTLEQHLADEVKQAAFLDHKLSQVVRASTCGVTVIIEDFVPRIFNQSRAFLSPVRVISMLNVFLVERPYSVVYQQPSLAKSTISLEYLAGINQRVPGLVHANDAVRHALTYLRR